jgi:hypothetical protein
MKKHIIRASVLSAVAFAAFSGTAHAADGSGFTETTFTASAFVVTLIISYLIPLVTATITKLDASATVKQFVTAVLAAINGFLTNALTTDGGAFFSAQALLFAVLSFATAQTAYLGTYKPHRINSKIAPMKGIG